MTIETKEFAGPQRSKRKPTTKQTLEQVVQRTYTEILATQAILHEHLKRDHNMTELQIKHFYQDVLTPKVNNDNQKVEQNKTETINQTPTESKQ